MRSDKADLAKEASKSNKGATGTQLTIGKEVEILEGRIQGLQGVLVALNTDGRVILALKGGSESVYLEIDCDAVKPLW